VFITVFYNDYSHIRYTEPARSVYMELNFVNSNSDWTDWYKNEYFDFEYVPAQNP